MLHGGCLCGAVRFEAGGTPFHRTFCHCETCRRSTGAPVVAWFSVPRAQFRFTQGSPGRFRSSAQGTRSFCTQCGSQLTFESDALPQEIDVTTCTLDDPAQLPPQDHTWTRSRLDWMHLADGLAEHAQARPGN
jgi:hypothetical protein